MNSTVFIVLDVSLFILKPGLIKSWIVSRISGTALHHHQCYIGFIVSDNVTIRHAKNENNLELKKTTGFFSNRHLTS